MVETVDEEEEVETAIKRRYPNRQRHEKEDMNWHCRGNSTQIISKPYYLTVNKL